MSKEASKEAEVQNNIHSYNRKNEFLIFFSHVDDETIGLQLHWNESTACSNKFQ